MQWSAEEEDSGEHVTGVHFLPLECGEHFYGRRPLRSKGFFTYNAHYTTALEIMAMGAMGACPRTRRFSAPTRTRSNRYRSSVSVLGFCHEFRCNKTENGLNRLRG